MRAIFKRVQLIPAQGALRRESDNLMRRENIRQNALDGIGNDDVSQIVGPGFVFSRQRGIEQRDRWHYERGVSDGGPATKRKTVFFDSGKKVRADNVMPLARKSEITSCASKLFFQ